MSFDIYTYNKTCQERLKEFRDILCAQKSSLLASCVFNEWKLYLRLLVQAHGWQAIWKISAVRCKELSVDYPAFALVQVDDVDFESLCASVNVIAVQDDFNLPPANKVPLQQLYPTRDQREEFMDVECIACALDQLRFFVINIWRPWDLENGVYDWVGEHLESRIQLHYDISKGIILPKTGKKIRALIREGHELQLQIDDLNDDEDCASFNDSVYGDVSIMEINNTKENTMEQLEARKQMIIAELAMLENPIQRSLIESRESSMSNQKRRKQGSTAPEACFVWLRGPAKDLISSLERARQFIANDTPLQCVESAQEALDCSLPGDTILLCAGQHVVSGIGSLAAGGILRGDSRQGTTVVGSPNSLTMFDIYPRSRKVSLSSLTLEVRGVQLGLLLQEGTVVLDDCNLVGGSCSVTQRGIVVMAGALLVANNCNFSCFGTAINVNKDGRLQLNGCTISKSVIGIQVEYGGSVSLSNTRISSCIYTGVKVLVPTTENPSSAGKSEPVETLKRFPEFQLEAVFFEGNTKDVLVAEKQNTIDGLQNE